MIRSIPRSIIVISLLASTLLTVAYAAMPVHHQDQPTPQFGKEIKHYPHR